MDRNFLGVGYGQGTTREISLDDIRNYKGCVVESVGYMDIALYRAEHKEDEGVEGISA